MLLINSAEMHNYLEGREVESYTFKDGVVSYVTVEGEVGSALVADIRAFNDDICQEFPWWKRDWRNKSRNSSEFQTLLPSCVPAQPVAFDDDIPF